LLDADRERVSAPACVRDGRAAIAEQSARRQGRGRGRHHPGGRRDGQRARRGARLAGRAAARAAALGPESVEVDPGEPPMKNRDRPHFLFALWLLLLPAFCAAQAYPVKPVRMVVTFTAGGSADFTGRLIADKWSEMWKQQVVVENRIGAGGNIGIEAVYRAPADGYTLLL